MTPSTFAGAGSLAKCPGSVVRANPHRSRWKKFCRADGFIDAGLFLRAVSDDGCHADVTERSAARTFALMCRLIE
jgi:hypothetical protein